MPRARTRIRRYTGFPASWRDHVARGEPFVARLGRATLTLDEVEQLGRRDRIVVKDQLTNAIGRARLAELARAVRDDDTIWYAAQQPVPRCLAPHMPNNPVAAVAGLRRPNFWLGSAGAHTTLHQDHMHNLVIQLAGVKRFTVFAPTDERYLYRNTTTERLRTHSRIAVPSKVALARFPLFRRATPIVVELGANDVFFMPAYWWHEVKTLEPSLMLNYWWPPTLAAIGGADLQAVVGTPEHARMLLAKYTDLSACECDHDVVDELVRRGLPVLAAIVLGDAADELVTALAGRGTSLYPETARTLLASTNKLSRGALDLLDEIRAQADRAAAALAGTPTPLALSTRKLARALRRFAAAAALAPPTRLVANNATWLDDIDAETYV